jgi:hypothetical protein
MARVDKLHNSWCLIYYIPSCPLPLLSSHEACLSWSERTRSSNWWHFVSLSFVFFFLPLLHNVFYTYFCRRSGLIISSLWLECSFSDKSSIVRFRSHYSDWAAGWTTGFQFPTCGRDFFLFSTAFIQALGHQPPIKWVRVVCTGVKFGFSHQGKNMDCV